MRQILVPVQATTDSNGAATIRLPLERTGEWRNVKVSLGTTGPAEWALVRSGTEVNFGRGRRVTLGPELLEPQDTLTVTVTGGPASAAISGSVVGTAGDEADIVQQFNPAPNTIALDTLAPSQILRQAASDNGFYSVSDVNLHTFTFPIPAGAQSFRLQAAFAAGSSCTTFQVTGNFTGSAFASFGAGSPKLYINHAFGVQAGETQIDDTRRLVAGDTTLTVNIQLGAGSMTFVLMSFNGFGDIVTELGGLIGVFDGFPIIVRNASNPQPWQAPSSFASINTSIAGGGGTASLVGAVAGQRVYMHGYAMGTDGTVALGRVQLQESGGGAVVLDLDVTNVRGQAAVGTLSGVPTAIGKGLVVVNLGAVEFVNFNLAYTQAP